MRLKIGLIAVFWFLPFIAGPLLAQHTCNYRLRIAPSVEKLGEDTIDNSDIPFFDISDRKIYFEVQQDNHCPSTQQHAIRLELKRHVQQQERLKPIIQKIIQAPQNPVCVDSLVFPDSLMNSGNYDLIMTVMGDSLRPLQTLRVPMQVLRDNQARVTDQYLEATIEAESTQLIDWNKTFVAKYPIEQLHRNIAALRPIAQGTEPRVIQELAAVTDVDVLKQFFYNFWVARNSADPEKAWKEYAALLNELASKYGQAGMAGYETDRGRIYIQYGPPDRVERVVNEKNALPYEVWFYYRSSIKPSKTNVKFLFFQPGILSSPMILLHSNQTDEIINPYWKQMLLEDPNNTDNKLVHKVFEFFPN